MCSSPDSWRAPRHTWLRLRLRLWLRARVEQGTQDEVKASKAQDIFVLGLLLYEAFAGVPLADSWDQGVQETLEVGDGEIPVSFRFVTWLYQITETALPFVKGPAVLLTCLQFAFKRK